MIGMTRRQNHPNHRGQKRIDLIIMAIAGLVLVGCGASVASTSTTNPALAASTFTSQSASAIVAQARAAMTAAGSVHAIGSGTVKKSGAGTVIASENNKSGSTAGSQILTLSSGSTVDISASFVDIEGSLYGNANAAFWATDAGATAPQAAALAGKWVQIPSTSPLYAKAAADLTMSTLTRDLFDAKTFRKGSVQSIGGVPAIKIIYANGGVDAGAATTYVAVGGKHLPVSADIAGLTLHMSSWGKVAAVSAPQGSVPLASVLATVPSRSTTT